MCKNAIREDRYLYWILNRRTYGEAILRYYIRIGRQFGARVHRERETIMSGVEDEFVEADRDGMAAWNVRDYIGIRTFTTGRSALPAIFDRYCRDGLAQGEMSLRN